MLARRTHVVVLAAADLAALRHVVGPIEDGFLLNLILSLLLMANVAAIVGYRLIRGPRTRRPFALGFLTCGLAAMAAHAACDLAIPGVMQSAYARPFRVAVDFCRSHQVPGFVARAPGGGYYFRYYPADLAAAFCLPQFLVAFCGGTAFRLWHARAMTMLPNDQGLESAKPDLPSPVQEARPSRDGPLR